ncbi:1-acyl-sn-glycerol-3-phosphate acyltransferase, partial [Streptomyces sp. NPDC059851]
REGRLVLMYAEGCIPVRRDAAEAAPGEFRSGLSRLAARTGAPVVPVGQAGARRVTSGSAAKQIAGLVTAPLRRPDLHVHVGAPVHLRGDGSARTRQAHRAVTGAWRTAAAHLNEPAALAA